MTNDELVSALNHLIETCLDGENGYRDAAAHVRNSELQDVFAKAAHERQTFARQLREHVTKLGGTPAESGTMPAALHRGWLDLKSALTGGSAAGIIAACETGEDSAQAEYQRVADLPLSGEVKTLVEKQQKAVVSAHAYLCNLKDRTKAGTEFPENL